MEKTDERLNSPEFGQHQEVRAELNSAVIGDVLDQFGRHHQFLPPGIRPMRSEHVMVGRAMPVLIADVFGTQRQPFGRLTEALDDLQRGEVYIAFNGHGPAAAWGEILTAVAKKRGAVGAVLDGYHRDSRGITERDWPVFSRGSYAQDAGARKSVLDYRVPIEIGQVAIAPGDLIFGDRDGVLAVPQHIEAEVLERAFTKVRAEKKVMASIAEGMSSTEAFATYGVL